MTIIMIILIRVKIGMSEFSPIFSLAFLNYSGNHSKNKFIILITKLILIIFIFPHLYFKYSLKYLNFLPSEFSWFLYDLYGLFLLKGPLIPSKR